jgi:tetratricopeptide (TPR) repeat protein
MSLWLEQDPLNVAARTDLAFFLNHAGMQDRAVVAARLALELDESYWFAHYTMGEIGWALGMRKDALEAAQSAYSLAPWNPRVVGLLAGALAETGETARAESLLGELQKMSPIGMLVYHLVRSDTDAAGEWYRRAIEQREMFTVLYASSPLMRPLRQSTHWPLLGGLINLPHAQA